MAALQPSLPYYEQTLDFLAHGPTPQEIIAYRPPAEAEARFSELIEANRQRSLTLQEEELDRFVSLDQMLSLLKAKAFGILDETE